MSTRRLAGVVFVLLTAATLRAQGVGGVAPSSGQLSPAQLAEENARLKKQIADLQAEVRALRGQLQGPRGSARTAPSTQSQPETTPSVANPVQPEQSGGGIDRTQLAIVIVAVVALGSVLVWFLVIVPKRRRRPLVDGLRLLARNDPATFGEVEALLAVALTTGLSPADVADARFGLAFVRARLKRYAEAESLLADLEAAGNLSPEAAYLHLWILAKQNKHDAIEALYDRQVSVVGSVLDAARIASVSFLHLGRKYLALRATAAALDYFSRVRDLQVLADQVPADLGDQHLIFGLDSAFERNWDEARKHFSQAGSTKVTGVAAKLGLLVCDWREQRSADVDKTLAALMPEVEKAHHAAAAARAARKAADSKSDGSKPRSRDREEADVDDATLLFVQCRVWYVLSLIRSWLNRPARTSLTAADLTEFATRINAAKAADESLPEPWLIEGLVGYYFATAEAARVSAISSLEKARELGLTLAEILMLLRREEENERRLREGRPTFIKMLQAFVGNSAIDERIRREVLEALGGLSLFPSHEFEGVEILVGNLESAPSVHELTRNASMTGTRLAQIVGPRVAGNPQAAARLEELNRDLQGKSQQLNERATELAEAEGKMTVYAGEVLLNEDAGYRRHRRAEAMAGELDKLELLRSLEKIEPDDAETADTNVAQAMSLARALRTVAELGAEHAYKSCRAVAEHVLGRVPEPPAVEE